MMKTEQLKRSGIGRVIDAAMADDLADIRRRLDALEAAAARPAPKGKGKAE